MRAAGVERGGLGRPGTTVELDGRSVCGIGAEINVNHVATIALDLSGTVVAEHRVALDANRLAVAEVLDTMADLVVADRRRRPRRRRDDRRPHRGRGRTPRPERASWSPSDPTCAGTTCLSVPSCAAGSARRTRSASRTRATSPRSPRPPRATHSPGHPRDLRRGRRRRRHRRRRTAAAWPPGVRRRDRPHDRRPGRAALRVRPGRLLGDGGRPARTARGRRRPGRSGARPGARPGRPARRDQPARGPRRHPYPRGPRPGGQLGRQGGRDS